MNSQDRHQVWRGYAATLVGEEQVQNPSGVAKGWTKEVMKPILSSEVYYWCTKKRYACNDESDRYGRSLSEHGHQPTMALLGGEEVSSKERLEVERMNGEFRQPPLCLTVATSLQLPFPSLYQPFHPPSSELAEAPITPTGP